MRSKARGTTTLVEIEYGQMKLFERYGKAYEELEKSNHANRAKYVGNGCHDCTKPHAA